MRVSAVFLVVCLGCAAQVPPPRTASVPAPQPAGATILSTALAVAETAGIPRMRAEKNLTWQSGQLAALAELFAKAGQYDRALQLIHDLDTPDRVKAPSFVPLVVAAIHAHDEARARMILDRLSALEPDWTVPIAFADIATAMEQAGDHAGAVRLLDKVDDPVARAKALLAAKAPLAALEIARDIRPASMHIPAAEGAFWEEDYSTRQSFLLELVDLFVDSGDLASAHKAMEALNDVPDRSLSAFRARAVIAMARREHSLAGLQEAMQEIETEPEERMGDVERYVEVLAEIAELSPSPALSEEALRKAQAALDAINSDGEAAVHVLPFICDGLTRIARADFALGKRTEALALLDRSLQLVERIPVPPPQRGGGSTWGGPGPILQNRCETKAHIAAAFEEAKETARAEAALASALAEITANSDHEWRAYSWEAIVKAYAGIHRLDRAVEILAAHAGSAADMKYALWQVPSSALLDIPRDRLWTLLQALPAGEQKVELLAQLAAQLESRGDRAEAARSVEAALATISTRGKDWELWLINLANTVPSAGQPGYEKELLALGR
jgi:tetratricopeptide (TPR) repeat protein